MKKIVLVIVLLFAVLLTHAQITSATIKANFGVDGDLRTNYFDGFAQAGNDDWFSNGTPGPGSFIIDTTGAAYTLARYATDANFRRAPFFRGMRHPQFSVVNNMMLIDGVFIRDHHGDDSTVFASGSNKNGMSPVSWSTPTSQGIPDKNDILDMMMHVRRQGPNSNDSLWLFGGVSIENTTGNRYFDFEMYQTDIYYDRPSLSFKGYGPDAGHTSWQFDAAGNVTRAGDIIFTAEYSSSSLSLLEARIWVNNSALSITPTAFNWGGEFDGDGAGATFGYANIMPNTAGYFYTGLQSVNNTWAGPFGLIRQDNSLSVNYAARQYMEFSVNLSKLGLDPYLVSNDPCLMPFRRILVKSRSSVSFTAELKDFVGPFSFFRAPQAQATADVPYFCGEPGVSVVSVNNPLITSLYTWSTTNGNIVSDTSGPSITVDGPGRYIVTQHLMDSCGTAYARDTVDILINPACVVLKTTIDDLTASKKDKLITLNWTATDNASARHFEIERSSGPGGKFESVGIAKAQAIEGMVNYVFLDDKTDQLIKDRIIFYRIKITDLNGNTQYSKIAGIQWQQSEVASVKLFANPVKDIPQLVVTSETIQPLTISLYDHAGRMISIKNTTATKGVLVFKINDLPRLSNGIYFIHTTLGQKRFVEKMVFVQ